MSVWDEFKGGSDDRWKPENVGDAIAGEITRIRVVNFDDGSRAWIASETFLPNGVDPNEAGIWEDPGIVAAYDVPTRWDLFSEANDPALAKAVVVLLKP